MLHRLSYILLICFLAGSASGQYPATGNKSRLGWQTTADGLVWRGAIGDTATIDPVGLLQAWALVDTASGVLYQYRGKAWRPVLAYAIQPFDSVVFNNNEGDADSAELKYNADIGSLVYGSNDGAQIPVLPGHWYVRNDTSVTLTKGTLVRAVGTIGASGRIKVRHMIADNSISAEYVMGIVVNDIPAGEDGYIMFYGKIRKLNTDVWNEGDLLYPDDFTPGALTNAPVYFKTPIAFVVHKSINQGVIAVRIQTENYLSRLHDVTLPGLAAQNILRYNGTYWIPGRDTSVYDFDARLKGNRTVLMNNFDVKFRNQYSENNYVQIRPTFVMVRDSATGEQATLNKYGIAGPVTGGYLSEVRLANGVYLNGSNSRFVEGLDTGDGYDVTIDTVGRVRFRVSATGAADSLYGKTSSGLLTAIKPNYLAYTDTASMLSTYLRPSEILAGTGITLSKDSTVTISAPTTLSSSTAIIDIAEVFVDNLTALRLPWDGTAVVGIIKTGLYLTSGVNEAFVQHELIPNGDKGDITTSAGAAVMTIDTGAVSLAKLSSGVRDTLALKLNAADTASLSTRIDAKQNTITGAATSITAADLTASRALVSDGSGKVAASAVTATELGYLSGVTSSIQTQLNTKLNAADTASLSNRIDLKLNIADTAAMLSGYIKDSIGTVTSTNLAVSAVTEAKIATGAVRAGKYGINYFLSNTGGVTVVNYLNGTISTQRKMNIYTYVDSTTTGSRTVTLPKPVVDWNGVEINLITENFNNSYTGNINLVTDTAGSYIRTFDLNTGKWQLKDVIDIKDIPSVKLLVLNIDASYFWVAVPSSNIDTLNKIATKADLTLKLNAADTASLSNRIDLKLNAADTASLSNRIDTKLNAADTASLSNRINAFPVTYEYTTVMTDSLVTIPPGCKTIEIVCIGGGGGGGSGRRGVASGQTVATGGTGGSGAAYSFISLDASAITAQLKITVGAGGTGGAARTTNDTNGENGTNGKASSVYTDATGSPANALLIYAGGGGAGEGGQSPSLGLDSLGERHYGDFSGKTGGYGDGQNADVFTGIIVVTKASGGGGGGGRITASTTENNGGNGGAAGYGRITTTNSGTTATPNATAGYMPVAGQSFGGGGGGGGASKASGAAGNGGAGVRGGGGGGGGASVNGVNSGAGGNGGTGYVRITFY